MREEAQISLSHTQTCVFVFIYQGEKGCNKGAACQCAHPKLRRASLTSKMCDRRNSYYYHVAGTLRPLTDGRPTQPKLNLFPSKSKSGC